MFLEDELEYVRLKRHDNIMGWLAIVFVAALVFMFAGVMNSASATGSSSPPPIGLVRPNGVNMGSLLLPSTEPGYFVEAPRLHTDVKVDVTGPLLRVKVTQRFVNPGKGWVEGTYVFPLPEDSAVDTLRIQIGDRFIEGQIKAKQEARAIYEAAKAEGKKTALLEQQRPNVFTNQVANIGPGETIVVQIEYQQAVHQSNGLFSFRFPMVVAPRYSPAPVIQNVDFKGNSGFAPPAENGPLPQAEVPQPPVLDPRENAKINPVTIAVNLNAGFPLGDVTSPYHKISMTAPDLDSKVITLNTDEVPADRDFELDWKAAPGKTPNAGLFRESVNGKTYYLAFVTPALSDAAAPVPPREVVFVLDNSGSMGGTSIVQAKQSLELAISRLKPQDRFNVIRFDNTMTVYFDSLKPADDENKKDAIGYVRSLDASGGTEMMPALKAALTAQGQIAPGALRQIVFLTDGAISNEGQLFDEIVRERGEARVFTVGIGSAPNSHFMTKAAEVGRGAYTHIGSEEQVAARMGELFAKLESPAMTDITAEVAGNGGASFSPDPVPDLYRGEPVVLTAALDGADTAGTLTLSGKAGGQPWRANLDLSKAAEGRGIAKLWARRKIDDIEATAYKANDPGAIDKAIERLALDHHLVSRVTSLVAVDVTPSRPSDKPLDEATVPLNLPNGWDFDKVFGEQQPTAKPTGQRDAQLIQTNTVVAEAAARYLAAAPSPAVASAMAKQTAGINLPQTATLADRDIWMGLMLLSFALMGGSFILLAFGGPRRGKRKDEDRIDVL